MGRHSTLVLTMAAVAVMTVGAGAQIQRVLLEQHTGTWCGWCPDGTVVVEEILDLYGDQVIGVKVHNGDAMVIPEQAVIANALGLTGFPTASINRKRFGDSVFLGRGTWRASCEALMQQRASAEVDCFYTLDKGARVVTIQVAANIVEPMDVPLRFNAFIVEDDVVGSGYGYDQSNYLSSRSGYEDNPYYDQPSSISGYHHMSVVRTMLGGAWGVAGDLPASVAAGEFYTHEFEAQIDEDWDMDHLYFVGVLQADAEDNKEIINSARAIENGALLNRIVDSNTPAVSACPAGSDLIKSYALENVTDDEQTYVVTLSTTARTPADWSAEFTSGAVQLAASGSDPNVGSLVVPANSTVELSLTLKVGSTLGVGDAEVIFALENAPTAKRSRLVSAIANEIESVLLETGSDYSLMPYLSETPYADMVTLDPSDYLAFAEDLTNVKLVIWNKGPSDGLSTDEMEAIKNAEDVNTFICGDGVIGSLITPDNLSYFGLEWIGWNLEARGYTGGVWLSGQDGDIITGDLGDAIEGRLIQYYLNMVSISDTANVFPIMHYQNDGFRRHYGSDYYIPAEETVIGVRSTRNGARTVLLGICPYVIVSEETRHALVGSVLDWLDGQ